MHVWCWLGQTSTTANQSMHMHSPGISAQVASKHTADVLCSLTISRARNRDKRQRDIRGRPATDQPHTDINSGRVFSGRDSVHGELELCHYRKTVNSTLVFGIISHKWKGEIKTSFCSKVVVARKYASTFSIEHVKTVLSQITSVV